MQKPPGDWRVPVPDEVVETANKLARIIKATMPPGWGFALLVFNRETGGPLMWLSDSERESMLKAMQEFMQKEGS